MNLSRNKVDAVLSWPNLAGPVVPPTPKCTICFGCACVFITGADVVPVGAGDLGGGKFLCGGSVTELTGTVATPAPERAVGFGGACVTATSIDFVPC